MSNKNSSSKHKKSYRDTLLQEKVVERKIYLNRNEKALEKQRESLELREEELKEREEELKEREEKLKEREEKIQGHHLDEQGRLWYDSNNSEEEENYRKQEEHYNDKPGDDLSLEVENQVFSIIDRKLKEIRRDITSKIKILKSTTETNNNTLKYLNATRSEDIERVKIVNLNIDNIIEIAVVKDVCGNDVLIIETPNTLSAILL